MSHLTQMAGLTVQNFLVLASQGVVQVVQLLQPVDFVTPKTTAAGEPVEDEKGSVVTEHAGP
jgi:K+-transporting ATPase A subunit